jgi:prephenate dehydrogenase
MMELAVIGLGLIGGSVALGAAQSGARVVGVDVAAVIAAPEAQKLGDLVDVADTARVERLVGNVDLVVMCAPMRPPPPPAGASSNRNR